MELEALLEIHRPALTRYVHYRIHDFHDAQDVLQETLAAAVAAFPTLLDSGRFQAWLIGIARNKVNDFLRRKYKRPEVLLDDAGSLAFTPGRFAITRESRVEQTLHRMTAADQQLLHMAYWLCLPHTEIARRLCIPTGTVKSRLYHARERFRAAWNPNEVKGAFPVQNSKRTIMPDKIPAYTITPSNEPPFECVWEELMGWFIVPRLGERLSWAMYDDPDGHRSEADELEVTGHAVVHDVEGVEISVRTFDPMDCNAVDDSGYVQRSFVAQLTDTHCRTLAETHTQNGKKHIYTFLDPYFQKNWGFGEGNIGNETHLRVKGDITRDGSIVTTKDKEFLLDVVGRYTVTIGGKTYDTICVMDVETYSDDASEQYIDRNGRTILWRRFNPDDWAFEHYGRRWTEMLPESERITINGRTFVHWYDCITSYIL
ncbi:MAG: RNA polymerase sigma factor [Clostridia bacterium]|nr:RNA polymerase sigma factor [Clostridia bacterium]